MVARPPPPCQAFDKPVCHASGSLPENCRISQVPMKPLHPTVSTARLAPAPRSTTPVEPVCLTNAAFPVLSTTLKHRGPRQCVNFRAQSRGSVLAVYASCRRYLRLRKTRLRLVVSLCRPRLRGVGFLRMVSPIVYLRYDSPFMGFAWRDRDVTLKALVQMPRGRTTAKDTPCQSSTGRRLPSVAPGLFAHRAYSTLRAQVCS